ncbi:MAG: shikimate dehydrogenase, partial [Limisphaerales bacterium]
LGRIGYPAMIKLGLIGYPLGHSLSPTIHTAALTSCGLDGSYSLFPIHPDNLHGLKDLLARMRKGEINGLNVTIPHKQNVIDLLDELTPTAEAVGAINTIYKRDSKLIGDNTDVYGFQTDLKRFLTMETWGDGDINALVLGAGGSARAIIYALVNEGWNVTLAARRLEQAKQLAAFFTQYKLSVTNYPLSNIDLSNITLIVNATPVGMTPNTGQSPWQKNLPFPPRVAIYDLVYNPRETQLVRDACAQGLHATTGLGMLIEQAALAFEIWTGIKPSREILFAAVNQTFP